MSLQIREVNVEDAKLLLEINNKLDEETIYRAYQPGERTETIESLKLKLNEIINSANSTIFVAELNGELIGLLEVMGGIYNRNKHSAHLVIAVLKEFWGLGIGRKLIENCINWAEANKIHRLDLSVFTNNTKAIELYEKMGFEKEGIKRDSFKISGQYVDEFSMSLLLD